MAVIFCGTAASPFQPAGWNMSRSGATPADVTQRLLQPVAAVPDFKTRKPCVLYAYLLKGTIREHYAHHDVRIFNEKTPIIFIAKREPGTYEIFTEVDFEEGGRMDKYFSDYEIIGKKHWPQAMFTGPTEALPQNLAPGLIMAGDHNGLGMEPAAISGIYAANKVLGRTIDDDPTVRTTVSAEPYLEPAGAKGMQATLESYGAVAADAGRAAAKVVADNKAPFIAGAAAAAAACAAMIFLKRR